MVSLLNFQQLTAANWDSISDIVPQVVGDSINYSSSNSTILPNKLSAICYVIDPADNCRHEVGGFDLKNGIVTKGYYNRDSATKYGLMDGDTANTGSNTGNSYYQNVIYEVFYDKDGSGDFNAPYNGYFMDDTEQLEHGKYSISGFSPYGSQNPGTFTFTTSISEPASCALAALNMAALGGRTNKLTLSVAVSNAVTFSVTYKNSLTNATWESLGTYNKTGVVTVVSDTNSVPQRFYRVVTP